MIAKRVWFKEKVDGERVSITDKLELSFHTVKYKICSFKNIDNDGVSEPFVLGKDVNKFMPNYLFIDYQKHQLTGDFTFNHDR